MWHFFKLYAVSAYLLYIRSKNRNKHSTVYKIQKIDPNMEISSNENKEERLQHKMETLIFFSSCDAKY